MARKRISRTKPGKKSYAGIWLLFAICTILFVGLLAYAKFTPANRVPKNERRPPVCKVPGDKEAKLSNNSKIKAAKAQADSENPVESEKVIIFKPKFEKNKLTYEQSTADAPQKDNKYLYAVNNFIKESKIAPAKAKALTCKIQNKIAKIEFSKSFCSTYGTEDEATLVEGILNVMGQFKEVLYVQFMCDGEPIDSLGNIDLSTPQRVIR